MNEKQIAVVNKLILWGAFTFLGGLIAFSVSVEVLKVMALWKWVFG